MTLHRIKSVCWVKHREYGGGCIWILKSKLGIKSNGQLIGVGMTNQSHSHSNTQNINMQNGPTFSISIHSVIHEAIFCGLQYLFGKNQHTFWQEHQIFKVAIYMYWQRNSRFSGQNYTFFFGKKITHGDLLTFFFFF